MKDKIILDACCGGKMFWFDRNNQQTLFVDARKVEPCIVGKGNQQAIDFVRKLIRMRRAMIRKGLSKNFSTEYVDELDNLIEYNKYDKPSQASSFFLRKRTEILSLLPGVKHPGYETLLNEFKQNLSIAEQNQNGRTN